MMRPSVTAPEMTLTLAKLAASITSRPSASRHSNELAAKASMATMVSSTVRVVMKPEPVGRAKASGTGPRPTAMPAAEPSRAPASIRLSALPDGSQASTPPDAADHDGGADEYQDDRPG